MEGNKDEYKWSELPEVSLSLKQAQINANMVR